jgi:hypothetical protein
MPSPRLSSGGRAALDAWLAQTTAARLTPALFTGVASANEVLYFACAGERVLGEPEKGAVDEDTSGFPQGSRLTQSSRCGA